MLCGVGGEEVMAEVQRRKRWERLLLRSGD